MKLYIILGKNNRVEKNSVEVSHPMPCPQLEDVFT